MELIRDEKKEVTDVIKNIEETLEKLDKLKDDLKYKEKIEIDLQNLKKFT